MICYNKFYKQNIFSLAIFIYIKTSSDWFNELLQKAKDKYHNCDGKEKAAEDYLKNKDVIKEKANKEYGKGSYKR